MMQGATAPMIDPALAVDDCPRPRGALSCASPSRPRTGDADQTHG